MAQPTYRATAHAEIILNQDVDGLAEWRAYNTDIAPSLFPELTIKPGREEHGDAYGVCNGRARSSACARTARLHDVYADGIYLVSHSSEREARRHKAGKPVITWDRATKSYRVWHFSSFTSFSIAEHGSLSAARAAADEYAKGVGV